jgi:hypothetical protein
MADLPATPASATVDQPLGDTVDEEIPEEPKTPPRFSDAELTEMATTYQAFIKKKQPNFVCCFAAVFHPVH